MITCKTLIDASQVPGAIAIESGAGGIIAYMQGDAIPSYCQVQAAPAQNDLAVLETQVASLQVQVTAIQAAKPVSN